MQPERFFLEWKEPYPLSMKQLGERLERKPTPQDVLLYGLLEPRNLLDIVRNFVVVRGRRRPERPQVDTLQAVHRRERGDGAGFRLPGSLASAAVSSGTRKVRARA